MRLGDRVDRERRRWRETRRGEGRRANRALLGVLLSVLKRHARQLWEWGVVSQVQIDLNGIDSSGDDGNDCMEIVASLDADSGTQVENQLGKATVNPFISTLLPPLRTPPCSLHCSSLGHHSPPPPLIPALSYHVLRTPPFPSSLTPMSCAEAIRALIHQMATFSGYRTTANESTKCASQRKSVYVFSVNTLSGETHQ